MSFNSIYPDNIPSDLFVPIDQNDIDNDLKSLIFPLYYFFDSFITENAGYSVEARKNILTAYDLYKIFKIDEKNIYEVKNKGHSTILYKFSKNIGGEIRYYLYYSNSGLGINNNIIINEHYVIPKIYQISESLYKTIYNWLESITTFVSNLTHDKLYKDGKINPPVDKLINNYILQLGGNTNKETFIEILKNIVAAHSEKRDELKIHFICTLFNYLALSKPTEFIECNFNNLLGEPINTENNIYKKYFTKSESETFNLLELFNNCSNGYNKKLSDFMLSELSSNKIESENKNKFRELVDVINCKLELLEKNSIKLVLNNLKVYYNQIFGISNIKQQSGSCTFYSFYFLKNILLLELFSEISSVYSIEQVADEYVAIMLRFHDSMIDLLCKSQDIKYLEQINYLPNDYFNHSYIYNLCDKFSITDELNKYYQSDTFILNDKKKRRIDYLLDFNIQDDYTDKSIDPLDYTFYIHQVNFIKKYVNMARDSCIDLISYLKSLKDDMLINEELISSSNSFINDFLVDIKKIHYIYLLILKHVHINKSSIIYDNKKEYTLFYYNKIVNDDNIDKIYSLESRFLGYDPLFLLLTDNEMKLLFEFIEINYTKKEPEILIDTQLEIELNKIYSNSNIKFVEKNKIIFYLFKINSTYLFRNTDFYIGYLNNNQFDGFSIEDYYMIFCKANIIQNKTYNDYKEKIIKYFRKNLIQILNYVEINATIVNKFVIPSIITTRFIMLIISNSSEIIFNLSKFEFNSGIFYAFLSGCKNDKNDLTYFFNYYSFYLEDELITYYAQEKSWEVDRFFHSIFGVSNEKFVWIKNINIKIIDNNSFIYNDIEYIKLPLISSN
jgi:hypothetical protein